MRCYGCDSETRKGPPITFQLFGSEGGDCYFLEGEKPSEFFIRLIDSLPGADLVIWGHNLDFDLISFFWDRRTELAKENFLFKVGEYTVSGIYSNLVFCSLKKPGKRVLLLDTYAYFQTTLDELAKLHCPDLPKLKRPAGLGSKYFTASDLEFIQYSIRDAQIAYQVGRSIMSMSNTWDIPLSVSMPNFSGKMFRKHFLGQNKIPFLGVGYQNNFRFAAHGGKNLIAAPAGEYDNCYILDIVSAYPHAMTQLPGLTRPQGYKTIKIQGTPGEYIKDFPLWGVYRVSGIAYPCQYPILFDADFRCVCNEFKNIWVSGPELNEGVASGELLITDLEGVFYEDTEKEAHPLREFAEYFFKMKREATNPIDREAYKLILNSLTGKFLEKIEVDRANNDEIEVETETKTEKIFQVGAMYNAFISALITGHTRAKIHYWEHKYNGLHTSTDSIITQEKPDPADLGINMGDLKIEAFGKLILFRNKLYLLLDEKGNIIKAIKHGFHGNLQELFELYLRGTKNYIVSERNPLKNSMRYNWTPNKWDWREYQLKNIPFLNKKVDYSGELARIALEENQD